jgi:hypothetical protein
MNDKIKISVKNSFDDDEIRLCLNRFATMDDWKHAFKTIMIHQTFCAAQVDEMFGEFEEYTSNPDDIIL